MSFLLRRGVRKNVTMLMMVAGFLYALASLTGSHPHRASLSRSRLEHLQQIRKSDDIVPPKKLRWGASGKPNVVESHPSKALHYDDCVHLPEAPLKRAKICIYPRKFDRRDSEYISKGKLLEKDMVKGMTDMLRRDHGMQLVDLGANIGIYSLSAASWGSKSLAVDLYPNNIRQLQTSLSTSGLSSYVTLVNNGLYSDRRQISAPYMRALIDDGTFIHIPKPNYKNWGITEENLGSNSVNTVCIDDLIPLVEEQKVYMRLNLDGLEAVALQCAFKFFEKLDVRVVQMRWLDKTQEEMDVLNEFMQLEWGFKASRRADQYIPANTKIPTAALGYVFWIKVPDTGEENEEEDDEEEGEEGEEEAVVEGGGVGELGVEENDDSALEVDGMDRRAGGNGRSRRGAVLDDREKDMRQRPGDSNQEIEEKRVRMRDVGKPKGNKSSKGGKKKRKRS